MKLGSPLRRSALVGACAMGVVGVSTASAVPQFQGVSTKSASNATRIAVSPPGGLVAGDVLIGSVDARVRSSIPVVPPPGWRLVRRDHGSSSAPLSKLTYVHVVAGNEPDAYVWRFRSATNAVAIVAGYRGVDAGDPIRGHGSMTSLPRQPQWLRAGRATASAGDYVVALFATSGTGRIAPAGGLRERVERGVGSARRALHAELSDGAAETALATAPTALSSTRNASNVGVVLTLAGRLDAQQRAPSTSTSPVGVTPVTAADGVPPKADFGVAPSVPVTVKQGATATTAVSVTAQNGFAGTVTLTASGLPSGVTAAFAPATVRKSGTATLTITAAATAPAGSYTATVTGVSGALRHAMQVPVVVVAAPVTTPPSTGEPAAPPPSNGTSTVGAQLPAPLVESAGATFYVATTGSDANAGTASAPWRTVQKALNSLTPGQTALVRAGNYTESLLATRGGSATAPITIRNYPGERPIVTAAGGKTENMTLQLGAGAAYLRIQGLTLQGATGPSTANIYAWGSAHDIELSYLEVRNSARQGLFADRTTARIQIRSSHFHDNGGTGPTQRDHNIYIEGANHLIASSLIRSAPNGYGVQIYPSNQSIVVVGNTITGNGRNGLLIGSDGATSATGARIIGNIITGNGEYGIASYWGGSVGSGNQISRNLVWGNGAGNVAVTGITVDSTITANPLFVNAAAGDFHLQGTSPALGQGVGDYTPQVDLVGVARPVGGGPDLGAFEQ